LAKPVEYVGPNTQFEITCDVYGNKSSKTTVFEDDGTTFDFQKDKFNTVILSFENGIGNIKRIGNLKIQKYVIKRCNIIP